MSMRWSVLILVLLCSAAAAAPSHDACIGIFDKVPMKGASKNVEFNIEAMFGTRRSQMTAKQAEFAYNFVSECKSIVHEREMYNRYDYNLQFSLTKMEMLLRDSARELSQAAVAEENRKIEEQIASVTAEEAARAAESKRLAGEAAEAKAETEAQQQALVMEIQRKRQEKAAAAQLRRQQERAAADKAEAERRHQEQLALEKAETEQRMAAAAEEERQRREKQATEQNALAVEIAAAQSLYGPRIANLGLLGDGSTKVLVSVDRVPMPLMALHDFLIFVWMQDNNAAVSGDASAKSFDVRYSEAKQYWGIGLVKGVNYIFNGTDYIASGIVVNDGMSAEDELIEVDSPVMSNFAGELTIDLACAREQLCKYLDQQ